MKKVMIDHSVYSISGKDYLRIIKAMGKLAVAAPKDESKEKQAVRQLLAKIENDYIPLDTVQVRFDYP
jgi:hypothetical protein